MRYFQNMQISDRGYLPKLFWKISFHMLEIELQCISSWNKQSRTMKRKRSLYRTHFFARYKGRNHFGAEMVRFRCSSVSQNFDGLTPSYENPRVETQHMHKGEVSPIFLGQNIDESDTFGSKWNYILGSLEAILTLIRIVLGYSIFVYRCQSFKRADIFGLQWSWTDIFGLPEICLGLASICICAECTLDERSWVPPRALKLAKKTKKGSAYLVILWCLDGERDDSGSWKASLSRELILRDPKVATPALEYMPRIWFDECIES